MLVEMFGQIRDVRIVIMYSIKLLKAYEEAYLDSFPISSIYLSSSTVNQMTRLIVGRMKRIHMLDKETTPVL